MTMTQAGLSPNSLLATILTDESFRPSEPQTIADTGLPVTLIEFTAFALGHDTNRNLPERVSMLDGRSDEALDECVIRHEFRTGAPLHRHDCSVSPRQRQGRIPEGAPW